jgi:hypothetical protein
MTKRNGISIVRIGLFAGLIGLLLAAFGVVAFLSDQASRRGPFDIEPYPDAVAWGTGNSSPTSRELFYKVEGVPPEQVVRYYEQKLREHTGDNQEHCVRNPPTGEAPTSPNVPAFIPYQYTCLFDNAGFRATQYTRVLIYPGSPNEDPFLNSEGSTVILYEQHWQS